MNLYASAGERVYGTRWDARQKKFIDTHVCTVRHDLFFGELPDFPACLGDWQKIDPPVARHFITQLENVYATNGTQTTTTTQTKTSFVDLAEHGGGAPAQFGVVWSGESWWRPHLHEHGGTRASLHYDLRFRSPDGTCTWRMDDLEPKEPA